MYFTVKGYFMTSCPKERENNFHADLYCAMKLKIAHTQKRKFMATGGIAYLQNITILLRISAVYFRNISVVYVKVIKEACLHLSPLLHLLQDDQTLSPA